ncbi:MAG: hypothetical protein HQK93_10595 [Nitrospirae bacterium]|nr:hypothetical protein [Nitrospirota bacterium]
MTSEDFAKIFHSNFTLNTDWVNIDEITWIYQQDLIKLSSKIIAKHNQFEKRLSEAADSKETFLIEGESLVHLVLKMFVVDYLINCLGVSQVDIKYEHPLSGFEVDVIDKDLQFPVECGDTNALKLEKYLALPSTKKMLIVPYPRLGDVKVFEFCANNRFFEYIKHKETFLKNKRLKYR